MQGIIFIGLQGSGKSTFYKERFFNSHMRISLDLLNTRNKERQFLEKCLDLQQRVVIDNTNPTKEERLKYLEKFKERKYETIAYYFQSKLEDCKERNQIRTGKERVPEAGILATYKRLELPGMDEGFDKIFYVEIKENNFEIKDWKNEI